MNIKPSINPKLLSEGELHLLSLVLSDLLKNDTGEMSSMREQNCNERFDDEIRDYAKSIGVDLNNE